MATKIRLKRMGKKFYAFYRVVIVDSRKKRDGKVIEEIGTYDPNTQPSTIKIKSERAQYWLGVGAQPSEPVLNLLKITGDWQKYKGLPGQEGTLKMPKAEMDAQARIEQAEAEAQKLKAKKSEAEAKAKAEAEAKAPKADEAETADATASVEAAAQSGQEENPAAE
ncbi:30S ribosomal protein S16 [Bifidobacterium xylocopae]|uniref:Small ribosomal subunit protein bS16 n=1 Tax=Bifidobacterium xylocopae TaxID=2493119 RepID=A0A366KDG0_9BIFI|nr:30S ribosomal protein S16 [Bifidobacterium xylocopae]RBP99750.1 30S ribosomal protein S16 [Bifidobacterium xylocopae]